MIKNTPDLWLDMLPRKTQSSHKYTYGHAVIYAAPRLTGATRLAAAACARIGAGLTSVLSPPEIVNVYRAALPAHIMVRDDLMWDDARVAAKLYGSGGLSVSPDFSSGLPIVLDADALYELPDILSPNFVLTPHEGEFARAFPDIKGTRQEQAQQAATRMNAHIVLKGAQTIIAAPDGRLVVNAHASPYLATAGTGDVLAGMITGLMAQGMPVFEACCAAVWIHGDSSLKYGAGLVASDLVDLISAVLQDIAS